MRLHVLPDHSSAAAALNGFDTGPRSIAAVKVLRISVTDRCNFRCVYCMPADGVPWLAKDHILSFEEIADIVRAAVDLHGITRFKLTGGEPTVRHGIVELIRILRSIPGVTDLSLTTNGLLLGDLARPMKDAGLNRITVSLDSLRPERFRRITRTGDLATVMCGLDVAESVGLDAVKINCVTMRGTNDDEIVDFARLSVGRNITVRFIEYMPLGDAALMHTPARISPSPGTPGEGRDESQSLRARREDPHPDPLREYRERGHKPLTPGTERQVDRSEIGPAGGCGAQDRGADALVPEPIVRSTIERELGPLVPIPRETESGVGPANVYRLARGNPAGRIGFISAMSAPFCSTCNRLRLTADGVLRSCLFEGGEVDVRSILRSESDRTKRLQHLARAMTECVRLKPDVHSNHGNEQMSRIGG